MSGRSGASTQARICTTRREHVSGRFPPPRAARRQEPKAFFGQWERSISTHRRIMNGCDPPAAGRGQNTPKKFGGRVIGTSRANEGGFQRIPHRHSPTGGFPVTTQRHKSGRDWLATDSQGDEPWHQAAESACQGNSLNLALSGRARPCCGTHSPSAAVLVPDLWALFRLVG